MRDHRRLCATLLLAGCFLDVGGDDDGDGDSDETDPGLSSASSSATGSDSAGTMGADATTQPPDDDGSTSATSSMPNTSSTTSAGSGSGSESDTGDEPFCDAQPPEVVLCYDFDGPGPFAGASLWEDHGSVDASDAHAVSPPRSMQVLAIGDPTEVTTVAIGRTLIGVPLPFAGELALQAWLSDDCFVFVDGGPERLLMALQFADAAAPDGPFLLNLTIWVTADGSTLYVSDQGMGFPSDPFPTAIPFPTEQWVPIALAFDATGTHVTLAIDGTTEEIAVDTITSAVIGEIAAVVPSISVGTAMGPGAPGCTMWFDDVVVTVD